MARLVAVCRDEDYPFERRQIPLMIEESLTMVMEIPKTVISTDCVGEADVAQFLKRYSYLNHNEMNCALMISQKELFALLAVCVPCVGCRRSVERLYNQLWESGQPALEPLIITASGVLTLSEGFLVDAKLIYALFYIHGSHLNDMVDTIPKSRRNRRCILHSLETHKARASGWMDVWDLLSQECRDEVVLIDSEGLLDTLENYLRKHRFCSECKSKVLKAYNILAGDIDGDAEKGYCAALYEGLKSCPKERHIHVVCDTDFIAHLIGRAEPELAGGRRERHARTIDIAQEEVLTCLGIYLWERLHRLWQKLRAEEQTWQILFYLGVEGLRKSFETAVEEKQGISQLELVVEEISEAERVRELRKENKRLKKKKRKENKKAEQEEKNRCEEIVEPEEKTASEGTGCSESHDESEKSSSESQASPRKSDEDESTKTCSEKSSKPCPKLSSGKSDHVSNVDTVSGTGLLTTVCSEKTKQKNGSTVCTRTKPERPAPCSQAKTTTPCRPENNLTNSKHDSSEECSDSSDVGFILVNGSGKCSSHSSNRESRTTCGKNKSDESCSDKENMRKFEGSCSTEHAAKVPRRNGFIHDDHSAYQKQFNKKNGYGCGSCTANVGPRLQNHDQHRYRYQGDVYDKCYSMNGTTNIRGRGKRKQPQSKDHAGTNHSCHGSHHHHNHTHSHTNHKLDSSSVSSILSNHASTVNNSNNVDGKLPKNCYTQQPEVENDEELRLLKSMGWRAEDGLFITPEEIQEYKANKRDLQTRRQELRDKLRDQFQKLSLNPLPVVMVNGTKPH